MNYISGMVISISLGGEGLFPQTLFCYTLPIMCCMTNLTHRIKIYGRLLCSHWSRYLSSERELLLCSSESGVESSSPPASPWACLWVRLWEPGLECWEFAFSLASPTAEFSCMRMSPLWWHELSPDNLAAWVLWGDEESSPLPWILWRWLQFGCMVGFFFWYRFLLFCLLKWDIKSHSWRKREWVQGKKQSKQQPNKTETPT